MQATLVNDCEPLGSVRANRWYVRLLPSLTDFAFVLPLFILFGMLNGATHLLSDGDTGWHIRTGEWILQHHAVPRTDFFSFTMNGRPWFAWEWGWDTLFAAVHDVSGLGGVVFLNVLLISLSAVLVFRLIRRYTNNDLLAFGFTMLTVCGSMIHWLARPHLVSWVFALVFAHLIVSAEQGNLRRLALAPVLMLAWTNLHGGFFIGILLLVTWAIADALQVTFTSAQLSLNAYRKSLAYMVSAVACAVATLANPYGWHLHQHVVEYLHDSTLLDNISEFQTISFHNPGSVFFECMLVLGIAAAFWCLHHRLAGLGLTVLLWAHAALFSGRNIPIFMLFAAPAAALMMQDLFARMCRMRFLRVLRPDIDDLVSDLRGMERGSRAYVLSGIAVLLLALGFASGKGVFQAQFNSKNFPFRAISIVHGSGIRRLFTSDQWADYMLYRYYPSEAVFFDGRSDFYGGALVQKYQHIMNAQYDSEGLLKKFAIDGVVVKTDAPVATLLKHSPDWKLLYDDGATIIFRLREFGRG
jgi:hypothetical protein